MILQSHFVYRAVFTTTETKIANRIILELPILLMASWFGMHRNTLDATMLKFNLPDPDEHK